MINILDDGNMKMSKYVINMLIVSLLPIFFAVVCLAFWTLLRIFFKKRFQKTFFRNWFTSTIVFIFLTYPTITSYAVSFQTCIEIEGIQYLEIDTTVICWSIEHKEIMYYYAIPVIIVWVIGFPVMIFLMMFKNRNNLNDKDTIMKYGLYYIGFKDQTFYW